MPLLSAAVGWSLAHSFTHISLYATQARHGELVLMVENASASGDASRRRHRAIRHNRLLHAQFVHSAA